MTTKLKASQVVTNAGYNLESLLSGFPLPASTGSLTLPDGTILKWGTLAVISSISSNSYTTVTLPFAVAFPTSCDFFSGIYTPNSSADFYGINSLVSRTKTQVQFTVKNGATAQGCSGGVWFALGR